MPYWPKLASLPQKSLIFQPFSIFVRMFLCHMQATNAHVQSYQVIVVHMPFNVD